MIIEIRDDDCYPCSNPIVKLETNGNLMHIDYPESRSIKELIEATRLCEIAKEILNEEIEKHKFSEVIEELGGFREMSKIIPLMEID